MATSLEAQHDLTVDSDGDTKGQHNVINSYNLVNVVHNANTLRISFASFIIVQYVLQASPCRIICTAISVLKRGCPITPIMQSVDAKQPSATLDLVFSRGFVLTANMTRAFKTVVMEQVITFMTITSTSIM